MNCRKRSENDLKNKMKELLKEKRKIDKRAKKTIELSLKTAKSAKKANRQMMIDAMTIYPEEYKQIYAEMEKLIKS